MSALAKLQWRWYRLQCMSTAEVLHRLKVFTTAKLQQRKTNWVAPEQDMPIPLFNYKAPKDIDSEPYVKAADSLLAGELRVLGKSGFSLPKEPDWRTNVKSGHTVGLEFGKFIDYRDCNKVGDIKYIWVPNRHNHWVTVAQAFSLTQRQEHLDYLALQLDSWLLQNPPYHGPSWISALENSLRLINWSFVWLLIGGEDSPLFDGENGQARRKRWLDSIYWHIEFIDGYYSRHSSANNHLLGELAGIVIAASVWPCWTNVCRWRDTAILELNHEALLQTAEDGVNKEQSTFYHGFVLEFLILAEWFSARTDHRLSRDVIERMVAMGRFYDSIMSADNITPAIGDADDGRVIYLSPDSGDNLALSQMLTLALRYGASDLASRASMLDARNQWLLGDVDIEETVAASGKNRSIRTAFEQGGYYILGDGFDSKDEIKAVVDAGDLGFLSIAAHGHADAIAMNLAVGGQPVLVDVGTFAYQSEQRWRDYFRSTSAHNTVQVDGKDQSEILGKFMWRAHAKARCEFFEGNRLVASHRGYQRLTDPVTHRRSVAFQPDSRRLVISDQLIARADHAYALHWHVAPDLALTKRGRQILIETRRHRITLCFDADFDLAKAPEIISADDALPLGWYSPQFMHKVPCSTIRIAWQGHGETRITTKISVDAL